MDDLDDFQGCKKPTASRPLLGMTILVVEDSRYTCEALRLLCLRSGARIRRADCLASARRHLQVYRPSAAIIDMGLPDGSGAELISDLCHTVPRVGVILGMSGDDGAEARAMEGGADGFLAKPVNSLAQFQETILALLPAEKKPDSPRSVATEVIDPDRSAYRDDMLHVANLLGSRPDGPTLDYVAQFLGGVARAARDRPLETAVRDLACCRPGGGHRRAKVAELIQMLRARTETRATI